MLRKSQDLNNGKPDSLLPFDRLVSRQSEIPLVVRTEYHVFYRLPANSFAGRVDPHLRRTPTGQGAISTLDIWVRANIDNQALPRSVWQDLAVIQGRTPRVCIPQDNGPGREIVYPGSLRPDMVNSHTILLIFYKPKDIVL